MSDYYEEVVTGRFTIRVDEKDSNRCSGRAGSHDFCQFLEKKQGVYQCHLFGKIVDEGDDDDGYVFMRCRECLGTGKDSSDIVATTKIGSGD